MITDTNDYDEDAEFYDTEDEPSICEETMNETTLNESIQSEIPQTYYAVQFKSNDDIVGGTREDR